MKNWPVKQILKVSKEVTRMIKVFKMTYCHCVCTVLSGTGERNGQRCRSDVVCQSINGSNSSFAVGGRALSYLFVSA